jgi:Calponin homology (CH) domain
VCTLYHLYVNLHTGPSWQRRAPPAVAAFGITNSLNSNTNSTAKHAVHHSTWSTQAGAAVAAAARENRSDSVLTVGTTAAADDALSDYPALMQWISAVTGEPFPGNSTTSSASAAVAFAQGLQDGVALCSLLVALQLPGAAPASTSPLQYKKLENIARFVRAARTAGVPAPHLFAPADLYEQRPGSAAAAARALHSLCLLLPTAAPGYTGAVLPVVESVAAGAAAAAAAAASATAGVMVDDMSDDDEPATATAKSSATATSNTGSTVVAGDAAQSNSSSSSGEPLLDATLEQAFASLDITAQSGRLNAMQFASLWRVLTGQFLALYV